MNKISIVLGIGYGDEGKGATVNSLCKKNPNSLVIRFSGGHQVGHTVVENDVRHIFSNFGSGALVGTPTYWSEYCTVNPLALKNEGEALKNMGCLPSIIFNSYCQITTPYDIYFNLNNAKTLTHGTVGVGFGATIQRNESNFHLYARDLYYPQIRDEKLRLIAEVYYKYENPSLFQKPLEAFKKACDELVANYKIVNNIGNLKLSDYKHFIFEGSQGILLDMDYGFFPHVTRSYTTSRNAFEIIKQLETHINIEEINTYYMTRAYQTRHGNGFLSNEDIDNSYIKINPNETNSDHSHQGKFRRSMLDTYMMKYAISSDEYHNNTNKHLVISCMDHLSTEKIPITIYSNKTQKNEVWNLRPEEIGAWLNINNIFTSDNEKGVVF